MHHLVELFNTSLHNISPLCQVTGWPLVPYVGWLMFVFRPPFYYGTIFLVLKSYLIFIVWDTISFPVLFLLMNHLTHSPDILLTFTGLPFHRTSP